MNDNAPKSGSCAACEVATVLGVIAGCYVVGFGMSGWLAIGVGLHVWLAVFLVLKRWPALVDTINWRG